MRRLWTDRARQNVAAGPILGQLKFGPERLRQCRFQIKAFAVRIENAPVQIEDDMRDDYIVGLQPGETQGLDREDRTAAGVHVDRLVLEIDVPSDALVRRADDRVLNGGHERGAAA